MNIGFGLKNTLAILAIDPTNTAAAIACANYSNNGKDDWFLPSWGELGQIYNNRAVLGIGNSGIYWSSSQAANNPINAWSTYFNSGSGSSIGKNAVVSVRAVRAF